MSLTLSIDTAQPRISTDSFSLLASGWDWDPTMSTDVYVEGVTRSALLRPGAAYEDWLTDNTGIYAKLGFADVTPSPAVSGDNWTTEGLNPDGAPFYRFNGVNSSNVGVATNATQPVNQPMVLEWFQDQTSSSKTVAIECGWSATHDYTEGVSLRFYTNGTAEVWKAGTLVGTYTMAGRGADYKEPGVEEPGAQAPSQYPLVLLIPCRQRELLVLSAGGQGFIHTFLDIAEGTAGATITDAAPFWASAPAPTTFKARIALCQFAASGTLISKVGHFRAEPDASPPGGWQTWLDADVPSGCGATLDPPADGVAPSGAYTDNTNGARLKVALSGGALTPTVYGARVYTLTQTTATDGSHDVALSDWIPADGLTFESSDSITGGSVRLTAMDPQAIDAIQGAQFNTPGQYSTVSGCSRPFAIQDGAPVMDGVLGAPHFRNAIRLPTAGEFMPPDGATYGEQTGTNLAQHVDFEGKDFWQLAEDYVFSDPVPLDGMTLQVAYQTVCSTAGLTPGVVSDFGGFTLPKAGNETDGRYNVMAEVGDKASDWLDRLHKSYCALALHRVRSDGSGGQVFDLIDPADIDLTPVLDLYDNEADAIGAGGTYADWFRVADQHVLPAEANDVYITGYDVRSERPIIAHKADADSMDATLPPGSRPENWLGGPRKYGWVDPTLTTLDACAQAISHIYPRVTTPRHLYEIECEFNPAMIRGAVICLHYRPGSPNQPNPALVVIKSYSVTCNQTGDDGVLPPWRPTRLVCQLASDANFASSTHTVGASLARIRAQTQNQPVLKRIVMGGAFMADILKRPTLLQSEH